MREFLKKIFLYTILFLVILETVIKILGLTDDVPQRKMDDNGLQVYVEGQTGYSHGYEWKINEYGFLGDCDLKGNNQLLIIGDSFIENFMNPDECRQSKLFKDRGLDVFEIGRSGLTFIEALEFLKNYSPTVAPKMTIIFMDNSDLTESIKAIKPYNDRAQFDPINEKVDFGEIKGKFVKKILYNYKTLNYLYFKYKKSRKSQVEPNLSGKIEHNSTKYFYIENLLKFSANNYNLNNVFFIFRKSNEYYDLFNQHKLNFIELNMTDSKYIFENDSHWNCKGHIEANSKVFSELISTNPLFK